MRGRAACGVAGATPQVAFYLRGKNWCDRSNFPLFPAKTDGMGLCIPNRRWIAFAIVGAGLLALMGMGAYLSAVAYGQMQKDVHGDRVAERLQQEFAKQQNLKKIQVGRSFWANHKPEATALADRWWNTRYPSVHGTVQNPEDVEKITELLHRVCAASGYNHHWILVDVWLEADRADLKNLCGKWLVKSATGKKPIGHPGDVLDIGGGLEFDQFGWWFVDSIGQRQGAKKLFATRPKKRPKEIDFWDDNRNVQLRGIYAHDQHRLTLALAVDGQSPRPTGFKEKGDDVVRRVVLERIRP